MPQASLFHFQGDKLVTDMKCTACDLSCDPRLKTNCMSGTGPIGATFLLVGHAAGVEDDGIKEPFTGANGRLFRELLAQAGYAPLRECYFTNCCKCAQFDKTLKAKHWKACQPHFLTELETIKPKVIVALGAQSFSWLTGFSGPAKFYRKSLPCVLDERYEVFPLRQPAQLFHCRDMVEANSLRNTMIQDLQWLKQHVTTLLSQRPKTYSDVDYKTITTHEEVLELFAELEKHPVLACDLETTSLFPHPEDKIVAIGFSWAPKQGRALPLYARGPMTAQFWPDGYVQNELEPRLRKILPEKELFGHNFIQFDQKWTRAKLKIDKLDIKFDTQPAHYCLDEERGTHDLEQLAVVYGGMKKWKRDFTLEDTLQLCEYLCKDVDALSRIRPVFEKMLSSQERWLLDNILIPLCHELFEIEYAGVRVSGTALTNLEETLNKRIAESEAKLRQHPAVLAFEMDSDQIFNNESPDHVRDIMQKHLHLKKVKATEGGLYSTDKEVLFHHKAEPFVADLSESRRLKKLRSTYCGQIRESLRNGYLHTSYKVHGTVTGRPSSSTPNLMNIPREDTVAKVLDDGSLIKSLFLPDPGDILLQADFNQAELRCLGSISGDRQLLGIYQRGEDAHTATAAIVYEIPLSSVTKAQRNCVKPINFGIPYGMSEEGLIQKFVEAGGTEKEARDFLTTHKRKFGDVWKYMDDQASQVRTFRKQTTYFGRSRRYAQVDNRALRQAYNFPIQSLASELTLLSLIRIAKAIRVKGLKARTLLTVYDSIAWSVSPESFWDLVDLVHHIMTTIYFSWMKVPMGIDLEAGWDWGNLKKVDLKARRIG
jgi:DNA polymerase I